MRNLKKEFFSLTSAIALGSLSGAFASPAALADQKKDNVTVECVMEWEHAIPQTKTSIQKGFTSDVKFRDFVKDVSSDPNWGGPDDAMVFDKALHDDFISQLKASGEPDAELIKDLDKNLDFHAQIAPLDDDLTSAYISLAMDHSELVFKGMDNTVKPAKPITEVSPSGVYDSIANAHGMTVHLNHDYHLTNGPGFVPDWTKNNRGWRITLTCDVLK